MKVNEEKFYQALENIFTGAKIEGDSGFVNLLKIKEKYCKHFMDKLKEDIEQDPIITESFKEEFFDKLYTFFNRYFNESGSVFFTKTPNWQRIYEQVYTDNEDVVLFWKTHMLYYVKTDILFQSIYVNLHDEDDDIEYLFYFDVGNLKNKQNNEKRDLVFTYRETEEQTIDGEDKVVYIFDVEYSKRGRKTKIDEIVRQTKIPETIVDKAFNSFRKQNKVDFFINKDADRFLKEQLDLYLHQLLLNEENVFNQDRLDQIKTLKEYGQKIISFIAQFEDELVKIWNKPKFAMDSNYIITLDKLNDDILKRLEEHENIEKQVEEWKELGMVDDNFNFFSARNEDKFKFLTIDTKYFKNLELDILSLFDDIDRSLDGVLIHSDNYQALNTLKNKYKENVRTVYIDPPFNSPETEINYFNNFKHSSWLTLMENRIELIKEYLTEDGIFMCAVDKQEQENLGKLLDRKFPNKAKVCVTVIHNPGGTQRENFKFTNEYVYFIYPDKPNMLNLQNREDDPDIRPLRDVSTGDHLRTSAANCFYPIYIKDEEILGFGDVCDDSFHPIDENGDITANIVREDGVIEVYPIDPQGVERKWVFARDSVENIKDELTVEYNNSRNIYDIIRYKTRFNYKTVWTDKKYNSNIYGKKLLNQIIPGNNFKFPKSLYNVEECILASSYNDSIILDYFPGSGTTANAIIKINKENEESKRKYILMELEDHLYSVIIPRIKKVCFSDKWKDGVAQNNNGISQFVKYYTLEQYEDTLRNMRYSKDEQITVFDSEKFYEQYIFFADDKFADVIEAEDNLDISLERLYPNIDLAETMSNIYGLPIKRVTETSVILKEEGEEKEVKLDTSVMNEEEKLSFIKTLRPLLWWGE